jgi:DNA-binding NtrC family response regulator
MFDNKHVLIIDDSRTMRNYVQNVLTSLGAQVDSASTGEKGLEKWADNPQIDLIVLDLVLPDMSGIDMLNHIREKDDEVAVMVLTGFGNVKSAISAVREGADGYIEKQALAGAVPRNLFI